MHQEPTADKPGLCAQWYLRVCACAGGIIKAPSLYEDRGRRRWESVGGLERLAGHHPLPGTVTHRAHVNTEIRPCVCTSHLLPAVILHTYYITPKAPGHCNTRISVRRIYLNTNPHLASKDEKWADDSGTDRVQLEAADVTVEDRRHVKTWRMWLFLIVNVQDCNLHHSVHTDINNWTWITVAHCENTHCVFCVFVSDFSSGHQHTLFTFLNTLVLI